MFFDFLSYLPSCFSNFISCLCLFSHLLGLVSRVSCHSLCCFPVKVGCWILVGKISNFRPTKIPSSTPNINKKHGWQCFFEKRTHNKSLLPNLSESVSKSCCFTQVSTYFWPCTAPTNYRILTSNRAGQPTERDLEAATTPTWSNSFLEDECFSTCSSLVTPVLNWNNWRKYSIINSTKNIPSCFLEKIYDGNFPPTMMAGHVFSSECCAGPSKWQLQERWSHRATNNAEAINKWNISGTASSPEVHLGEFIPHV